MKTKCIEDKATLTSLEYRLGKQIITYSIYSNLSQNARTFASWRILKPSFGALAPSRSVSPLISLPSFVFHSSSHTRFDLDFRKCSFQMIC